MAALMATPKERVRAHPDRADYQRDLSVSYNKLGDLLSALGQGEQARAYYQKSLEIAERLAGQEPDRGDLQTDIVVSLIRMAIAHRLSGRSVLFASSRQTTGWLPSNSSGFRHSKPL